MGGITGPQIYNQFLEDLYAGRFAVSTAGATNAAAFGATGNGLALERVALQEAIDATPLGGVLYIPAGRYRIEAPGLVFHQAITIQGAGGGSYNSDYYGGSSWDLVKEQGTILESPMTSGAILTFDSVGVQPFNLRDLAIKGLGDATRTTVGVNFDTNRASWWNVTLINLFIGAQNTGESDDNCFSSIVVNGCATGWYGGTTTFNQNTFIQFGAMACDTGLRLREAVKNVMVGGAFQGSRTWAIDIENGEENDFWSLYFENISATGGAIRITQGDANRFYNYHAGAVGDRVVVNSHGNLLDCGKYHTGTITLGVGTTNNRIIGNPVGAVVDSGLGNVWIKHTANGDIITHSAGQPTFDTHQGAPHVSSRWVTQGGIGLSVLVDDSVNGAALRNAVNNYNYIRFTPNGTLGNLGFYNVTPVARQLLATGAGATVDQVITALQNLGLLRQT